MAKFHIYEITITATISVPASVTGEASTFVTTAIPAAAQEMLAAKLVGVKPSISVPVVTLSAPVEYPAVP